MSDLQGNCPLCGKRTKRLPNGLSLCCGECLAKHRPADTIQSLTAKLERAKEALEKIKAGSAYSYSADKHEIACRCARQALKDIEND